MLLACQAHLPSLHPAPCDVTNSSPSECTTVSGRNLGLLTLGLYVVPVGEGAVRVCAAALGGDQFDREDPRELRGAASFFNWYTFCISLGGFAGLLFVVWVQDNEGWDLAFALSALVALLGTLVLVAGMPFYRHQKPTGSPLTRILQVCALIIIILFLLLILVCMKIHCDICILLMNSFCTCEPQVFVAAFRKRNLSVPEDFVGTHETTGETGTIVEVLERTSGFK